MVNTRNYILQTVFLVQNSRVLIIPYLRHFFLCCKIFVTIYELRIHAGDARFCQ